MIPFTTCLCAGGRRSQDSSVDGEETTTTAAPNDVGMTSTGGGWIVVTTSGHLVATSGGRQETRWGRSISSEIRRDDSSRSSKENSAERKETRSESETQPRKSLNGQTLKRRGASSLFFAKPDKSSLYLRKFGSKHAFNNQQPLSHQPHPPLPPSSGADLGIPNLHHLHHHHLHHLHPSPTSNCPSSSSSSTSQQHLSLSSFRQKKTWRLRQAANLDDSYHGQTERLLATKDRWSFNVFALNKSTNGKALSHLCLNIFREYDLFRAFDLDLFRLRKCLTMIEDGYHNDNPYHNALHAADVCQAMHCYLKEPILSENLSRLEILSAFLASICHDLDHPGVNQSFLVATSNPLAALYENTSVLENHHWRAGVSILRQSRLLERLDVDVVAQVEAKIKSLILATDITRQHEFVSRFKSFLDDDDDHPLSMTSPDSRHFVLQIALKCADISNPCRNWRDSRKWSEKVTQEFFQQGDFEREICSNVTPLCDRFSTSVAKIQFGFIEYVCFPLFREWKRFNPSSLSDVMLENMSFNQKRWKSQTEATEAAEEKENLDPSLELSAARLKNSHLRRRHSGGELLVPRTHSKSGYSFRRGSGDELLQHHAHLMSRVSRRGSGDELLQQHHGPPVMRSWRRGSGDELLHHHAHPMRATRRGSGDDLLHHQGPPPPRAFKQSSGDELLQHQGPPSLRPSRRGSGEDLRGSRRGSSDEDMIAYARTTRPGRGSHRGEALPFSRKGSFSAMESSAGPSDDGVESGSPAAESIGSSRVSSRASLNGCLVPSEFLPRRHSLPHVSSMLVSGGDESGAGTPPWSTPPSATPTGRGFICVDSLLQSQRDSLTTRRSISAARRSSMPLTPSSQGNAAHLKALGIGSAVMERLHYIYGRALAGKKTNYPPTIVGSPTIPRLNPMSSPASSVQEALDSLDSDVASLHQSLCGKAGAKWWRSKLGTEAGGSINYATFPLESWMHRPRISNLSPNVDVSWLASLSYQRLLRRNPLRRFSKRTPSRFPLIVAGPNGKCLEVGASGRVLETVPATPDPLHVTFEVAASGDAATSSAPVPASSPPAADPRTESGDERFAPVIVVSPEGVDGVVLESSPAASMRISSSVETSVAESTPTSVPAKAALSAPSSVPALASPATASPPSLPIHSPILSSDSFPSVDAASPAAARLATPTPPRDAASDESGAKRIVIHRHEQRLIVKTPDGDSTEKVIVTRFSKSRESSPAAGRRRLRLSLSAGNVGTGAVAPLSLMRGAEEEEEKDGKRLGSSEEV